MENLTNKVTTDTQAIRDSLILPPFFRPWPWVTPFQYICPLWESTVLLLQCFYFIPYSVLQIGRSMLFKIILYQILLRCSVSFVWAYEWPEDRYSETEGHHFCLRPTYLFYFFHFYMCSFVMP